MLTLGTTWVKALSDISLSSEKAAPRTLMSVSQKSFTIGSAADSITRGFEKDLDHSLTALVYGRGGRICPRGEPTRLSGVSLRASMGVKLLVVARSRKRGFRLVRNF